MADLAQGCYERIAVGEKGVLPENVVVRLQTQEGAPGWLSLSPRDHVRQPRSHQRW
jgi:hypothetical protein